jgi:putative ABC transport system permease protein
VSPATAAGIAVEALRANLLRSVLAMLGVIIGVASVIVMAAVANGARDLVDQQIRSLGANTLLVTPGSAVIGGRQSGAGTAVSFSEADVAAIEREVPGVLRASGQVRGTAVLVAGGENWTTTVQGVQGGYLEIRDWPLAEGRAFAEAELRGAARVALIGETVAKHLAESGDPLGLRIRIGNVPFEVIGILATKGQTAFGTDQDDVVLVPISTARRRLLGNGQNVPNRVQNIMVELAEGENGAQAEAELVRVLRERRRLRDGVPDNFHVRNMAEFIRARAATQNTLGLLLGAAAAISLLVGGVGIMNIMLVTVTERTREIGLRKAVGARRRDILQQFLIEATALCLAGGLLGLSLGWAIAKGLVAADLWPARLDLPITAIAVAASGLVGIAFGFWPARRAARLSPIEALRHE